MKITKQERVAVTWPTDPVSNHGLEPIAESARLCLGTRPARACFWSELELEVLGGLAVYRF